MSCGEGNLDDSALTCSACGSVDVQGYGKPEGPRSAPEQRVPVEFGNNHYVVVFHDGKADAIFMPAYAEEMDVSHHLLTPELCRVLIEMATEQLL